MDSKEKYVKLQGGKNDNSDSESTNNNNSNNNDPVTKINEALSEITNLTTQNDHVQLILQGLKNKQPNDQSINSPDQLIDFYPVENDEQNESSIAKHPKVTRQTKILIPLFLLINTGMFIYCNIADGAIVQAQLKIYGFQTVPSDISAFSLYGSIKMMYKSGAVFAASFIFLFSGLWPYIKIIGMYVCWFLPQNKLSFKKRDRFLTVLDIMGKWSLIDTYFMVVTVVAMKVNIDASQFVHDLNVSFNITATPLFDFFCYLLATMLSLILTHFMIYNHRKTVEKQKEDSEELTQKLNEKIAMGQNNKFMKYWVPFVVFVTICLSGAGYFLDVIVFDVQGLAGWAMGDEAENIFSIWTIAEQYPYKTYDPNSIGIRLIQVCIFLFTLLLPMIFFIIIAMFYIVPIKLRYQQKLFYFTEILYSWSSIDVASLALVTVTFQTEQIAVYNIGAGCDGINQVIKLLVQLFPETFDLKGSDTCYDISTELKLNSAFLFIATALFMYIGTQPLRSIQEELETRLEQCGQRKISYSNFEKYQIKQVK